MSTLRLRQTSSVWQVSSSLSWRSYSHVGAPCVFEVLVGREGSDVKLPTEMYVTYAYIDSTTAWWDVDFYVSPKFSDSNKLWEYVKRVVQRAREKSVQLLEFTVFRDGEEIWRGNF